MSRISPIVPGGIFTGGSPATIIGVAGAGSGSTFAGRWLLGAKIHMGSGIHYVANDYIGTGSVIYKGVVIDDFGFASRSTSAPAGLPIVGDGKIRLDDETREWRGILSAETARGQLIEIVRISDDEVVGGFEITKALFGDGWVEFQFKDLLSKCFNTQFLGLIDRTIFPYLVAGVDSDFMPMVLGNQFSSVANPQGRVRCPHIGVTTIAGPTSVDRFCMSRFTLAIDFDGATVIYRKLAADANFSVVSSSLYTITQGETITVHGQDWSPTYVDFFATQAAGTEIRCDTYGIGTVVSIGTGLVTGTPNPIRNPIDLLSYIIKTELGALGGDNRDDRYNADNFAAVRAAIEAMASPLRMDGVIDTPITLGAFLSQWTSSFEIKFFINRHYQYDVALVTATDPNRDVVTFAQDSIQFTPATPDAAFNRWIYYYGLVRPTAQWAKSNAYESVSDQVELGASAYQLATPRIEALKVYLYFVEDDATAASVIARRSNYERIGSNRASFTCDLPLWFDRLELGQRIGLTDPFGISANGWDNVEMETLSLYYDFGALQIRGTCVMRTPVTYGASGESGMTGGLVFLFLN